MTLGARIAWIVFALGVVGGGIVVASLRADRTAAMEAFEQERARETSLAARLDDVDERFADLFTESRDQQDLQDTCRFQLVTQERDWNQLLADIPSIFYSPSDLDPYVGRAKEMIADAREIAEICSEL